MGEARTLFQYLLYLYPALDRYLGSGIGKLHTETIVHSVTFEIAIANVCNGDSQALSNEELEVVKC